MTDEYWRRRPAREPNQGSRIKADAAGNAEFTEKESEEEPPRRARARRQEEELISKRYLRTSLIFFDGLDEYLSIFAVSRERH
jgi:hypothetical protein